MLSMTRQHTRQVFTRNKMQQITSSFNGAHTDFITSSSSSWPIILRPELFKNFKKNSVIAEIDGQGSFPVGTPGNGVPEVILTVGTAFKPALGELYKKHPVCSKICLFKIQNRKIFLGRGHSLPRPLPWWEKDNPSPCPTPFGA